MPKKKVCRSEIVDFYLFSQRMSYVLYIHTYVYLIPRYFTFNVCDWSKSVD